MTRLWKEISKQFRLFILSPNGRGWGVGAGAEASLVFSALCSLGTCSLRAAFPSLYPCNDHNKIEFIDNSKGHLFLCD